VVVHAHELVVTEIATPTPMLARVSTARHPRDPGRERDRDCLGFDVLLRCEADLVDGKAGGKQVEQIQKRGHRGRNGARQPQSGRQGKQSLRDEPRSGRAVVCFASRIPMP
jgi:hypothetical protein